MKKIASLLLLAAVVYAASAYVLGGQVREGYFRVLEENDGGLVALSNQSYERGLFSSSALTLVEVRSPHVPAGNGTAPRFAVRHVFHHGPLPLAADLRPGLAAVDSVVEPLPGGGALEELFAELPELARTTSALRVGFDGIVEGVLLVPAFERRTEGKSFVWSGLRVNTVHDPATGSWTGGYDVPGLTAGSVAGSLSVQGASGTFDLVEVMPMFFVGHAEGELRSLNATDAENGSVEVSDVRFVSDSSVEGGLVRSRQVVEAARISGGGVVWGPVSCDMETRNVDAAALGELMAGLEKMESGGDVGNASVAQLPEELFGKVLAGNPEFRLNSLKMPGSLGNLEAAMQVRLHGDGPVSLANPMLLLGRIQAEASLALDESLLTGLVRLDLDKQIAGQEGETAELARRMVAEKLDPLLARKLVVREGGVLKVDAAFRSGRLTVNGQDAPLY